MDTWDKLIAMAEETTRCAKIAEENIRKTAAYWRLKHDQEEEKEDSWTNGEKTLESNFRAG